MVVAGRRTRRRRPTWLVLAVALTAIVLLVNAAGKGGDRASADRTLAYLDEVRPVVEQSTRAGGDLADIRANAAALGRAVVDRRLTRLAQETDRTLRDIARLEPPEDVKTAHGLLVATMAARAHGTKRVKETLERATESSPPESAIEGLVSAGRDLVAGDRNYALFLERVPEKDDAVLPPSVWVPDPFAWDPAELQVFVFSLRATSSLQPVLDTAVVTFATEPVAVATQEGGVRVLPPTKTVRLQIVVANTGNQAVKRVPVVAEVNGLETGSTDTARDFVDLAPGQRLTVQLGGLRPALTGPSELKVRVGPIEGETNVADNERALTFVVR